MHGFFLYILYWASFMNTSARYHPEIFKAPCIYSAGFAVSGIVWVNTPWIFYMGSMHLILANRDKGGAVWSGFNMVNCLQNIHNGDLVAHLGKWDIWCLCDFEVWLMFFLCCCYAVYNIVLYCYLFFNRIGNMMYLDRLHKSILLCPTLFIFSGYHTESELQITGAKCN